MEGSCPVSCAEQGPHLSPGAEQVCDEQFKGKEDLKESRRICKTILDRQRLSFLRPLQSFALKFKQKL